MFLSNNKISNKTKWYYKNTYARCIVHLDALIDLIWFTTINIFPLTVKINKIFYLEIDSMIGSISVYYTIWRNLNENRTAYEIISQTRTNFGSSHNTTFLLELMLQNTIYLTQSLLIWLQVNIRNFISLYFHFLRCYLKITLVLLYFYLRIINSYPPLFYLISPLLTSWSL